MIVINSSAIVAVMFGEPDAPAISAALASDLEPVMSVVNYVETGTVLSGRRTRAPRRAIRQLDAVLREIGATLVPVDENQARIALGGQDPLWARHGTRRRAQSRRHVCVRSREVSQCSVALYRQRLSCDGSSSGARLTA